MGYAKGKKAFGYCDKTGFRYKLRDLVYEVQNGTRTGLRVGRDVLDPDHPQNFIGRVRASDNQSLKDPRPDTGLAESRALWGWNPVGNVAQDMVCSVGAVIVTVTEE
jgi:hypothetical protein